MLLLLLMFATLANATDYIVYPCELLTAVTDHYEHIRYTIDRDPALNQYNVVKHETKYFTLAECESETNPQFDAKLYRVWAMNEVTEEWQMMEASTNSLDVVLHDAAWLSAYQTFCGCDGTWEVSVERIFDPLECPTGTCDLFIGSKFANVKTGMDGTCEAWYLTALVSDYDAADTAIDKELRVEADWGEGACDPAVTTFEHSIFLDAQCTNFGSSSGEPFLFDFNIECNDWMSSIPNSMQILSCSNDCICFEQFANTATCGSDNLGTNVKESCTSYCQEDEQHTFLQLNSINCPDPDPNYHCDCTGMADVCLGSLTGGGNDGGNDLGDDQNKAAGLSASLAALLLVCANALEAHFNK